MSEVDKYNSHLVQQLLHKIQVYEDILKPIARAALVTDKSMIIYGNTGSQQEKRVAGVLNHAHLQAAHDALVAGGLEHPYYDRKSS